MLKAKHRGRYFAAPAALHLPAADTARLPAGTCSPEGNRREGFFAPSLYSFEEVDPPYIRYQIDEPKQEPGEEPFL
ncbi:hypothetical protein D7024_11245 [Desulfofundulus salinus]|uniref:Uncharacterized protein n=1 Tax=Desulfofundulus salinus TaxID=2419843 RepID=A0A494WWZ3_9FIRM|nr:hypothetical protein D7024_11245 [Desulfofundulus salinum]